MTVTSDEHLSDQPTTANPEPPSRRGFFLAAAAALAVAGREAGAQQRVAVRRKVSAPVRGLTPKLSNVASPPDTQLAVWRDPIARLVRRVTLGITKEELARAKALGYSKYLEEQLRPSAINDGAVTAFVATTYRTTAMSPDQLYTANYSQVLTELQDATLYRAAFSRRQLQERMVEFWTDHFNINRDDVGYLKTTDDRDVIRRHALGRFPDLLKASAHSAAMMEYLDQTRSRRGSPNENYAREIMELHTVGVDGGYTQQDVAELARVFTGWTNSGRGIMAYDATIHDFGVKKVLGKIVPSTAPGSGLAGKSEADKIIDTLALHPNTAKYIAGKLTRFLLQYDPPDALVTSVAATFTSTRGDIPSMIRVILAQNTLMAAPAKYKRPFHLAVSAVRALNPTVVTNVGTVRGQVDAMGQPLFAWPTPDGYPTSMEFWMGLVMQRWNAMSTLANASSTSTTFAVNPEFFRGTTAEATVDLIAERLFGGEIPNSMRTRLADYVRLNPTSTTRIRETVGLALSSSQFQWY